MSNEEKPTEEGWYWWRGNYGDRWEPVQVRRRTHPGTLYGGPGSTITLCTFVSYGRSRWFAVEDLHEPYPVHRWGPRIDNEPPPEPRQEGPRGTPEHPCEHCGQTTKGHRMERGFQRCKKCGHPGQ